MSSKRAIVVTGAASGLGAATTRRFADEGFPGYGLDRSSDPTSPGSDPGVQHFAVDICSDTEVQDVFAGHGGVADTDPDAWRSVMAVNLDGVFYGMSAALPTLRANQTAAIINGGSIAADGGETAGNNIRGLL